MKVRFYIEKRKDETGNLMVKERPVFMSVSFSGNRVILGTGMKIDFHGWDPEQQRVKSSYPESIAYNARIETLVDTAALSLKTLRSSEEKPDIMHFKKVFHELRPRFSSGFFDIFYLFMEVNIKRWSTATYRKVRTTYKHLREFETETGYRITFKNMNDTFLEKFQVFYSEKGNSKTTTYKAVNNLVWFLNWATEQGYNVNRSYRKFYKLMAPTLETSRTQIFLHWEELMKFKDFIPWNRRIERVKDIFCFMCFSGIRFSELQALGKEDIGREEIVVRKNKNKLRRLPLNKYSTDIYETYRNKYYLNNKAFPSLSIITMNKYLRLIGKEVGLNREISGFSEEGAKTPLHEHLTAGIAVNTFIANALELKVTPEFISSFTGVRNDSRIQRIKMELAREEMKKIDQK